MKIPVHVGRRTHIPPSKKKKKAIKGAPHTNHRETETVISPTIGERQNR